MIPANTTIIVVSLSSGARIIFDDSYQWTLPFIPSKGDDVSFYGSVVEIMGTVHKVSWHIHCDPANRKKISIYVKGFDNGSSDDNS